MLPFELLAKVGADLGSEHLVALPSAMPTLLPLPAARWPGVSLDTLGQFESSGVLRGGNQIHEPKHPHEGYAQFVHLDVRHQAIGAEGVRDPELSGT